MTTDTETFLGRFDCTHEHDPALDLRAIDLVASVLNQARFESIDRPTVDRYIAALAEGATFPPVLLRRIPRPDGTVQLVILSGNHRTRAHIDNGDKTIDAYLVTCDDLVALEIAYADNATHGLPTTDAERIAHVLTLVEHGRRMSEACRMVGIGRTKVDTHVNARTVEDRARRLGVALELAGLAEATKHNLVRIADDRVFAKLVRTLDQYNVGAGPAGAQRIISDINSQPDVASAMDAIALHVRDLKDRPEKTALGRPPENPYLKLRLALGQIKGLNAADVVDKVQPRDLEQLHDALVAGARHLMAIDTLAQAQRQPLRAVR